VNGALVLTTSLVITLRSWRVKFGAHDRRVASAADARDTAPARLSGARA
jgi:hypothetical protein